MFSLGFAELAVIAVLGLLIFGPDRLPKAVQSLMGTIRTLRKAAGDATKQLQEASGVDESDAKQMMTDIADLHPKRWAAGLLDDDERPTPPAQRDGSGQRGGASHPDRPTPTASGAGADTASKQAEVDPDLP